MTGFDAAFVEAETLAWLDRAVIGLNLCPFAKSVVVKKQLRYALTLAGDPDQLLAEIENELALLAASDPQALDTTLLIHPHVLGDFLLTEASQVAEAQDLELIDRHVDGVAARQAIRGKTAIFGDDSDAAQFFASSCHTCSLSDICQQ